jgi:type VI secretion system protein ImpF
MKERKDGYFQISLMNVFRQAAESGDARRKDSIVAEGDDAKVLSARTLERRAGAGQSTLKSNLAHDLANLMGTIHLEAAEDLEGLDYVRNSVLNYGLQDMTRLTTSDVINASVMRDLKKVLLRYEPRLIPETVEISPRQGEEDTNQRLAFDISAEMAAKPADVPLEFVAEIDTGAGKVAMSNLSVRG